MAQKKLAEPVMYVAVLFVVVAEAAKHCFVVKIHWEFGEFNEREMMVRLMYPKTHMMKRLGLSLSLEICPHLTRHA